MDYFVAFAGGLLAGLAVAVPLGPVGVLLVKEGLVHGFAAGAPAAAAVAVADTAYCALALSVGAVAAPVLRAQGDVPALVGGIILVGLGVAGICRAAVADHSRPVKSVSASASALRRFALFLGLTAINPATLVFFAALAAGFGGPLAAPAGPAVFVAGVAMASLGWQLGLVGAGAVLHRRLTGRVQRSLGVAGSAAVVVLGMAAVGATLAAAG